MQLSRADSWLQQAGARSLGVRASGRGSYTLADAAVDVEKSDAEQERAAILLLAEDALVNGVRLTASEHLEMEALKHLLELALICELDIARASPLNDRAALPISEFLQVHDAQKNAIEPDQTNLNTVAETVAEMLLMFIEKAKDAT